MVLSLQIMSYEKKSIDSFAEFARRAASHMGAEVSVIKGLPMKIRKWSVLASPHVFKTAWSQFERREHCRKLDVFNLCAENRSKLLWYIKKEMPDGVWFKSTSYDYE